MAGKIVSTTLQINDHATATNNFVLKADNAGGVKLSRGNDGATTQDILSVASDGKVTLNAVLSNRFTSAEQTITSGGTLTIAHGLGVVPFHVNCFLICKTAEAGYTIGDVICTSNHQESSSGADAGGISLAIDTTNIVIRYGSNVNTFTVANKTTGTGVGITNANWRLIVKVEA